MKKIHANSDIAHLWANKIQEQASNSNRSYYFEDYTIYSYGRHFPIAVNMGDIILMTYRSYSNSTAKHINYVNRAITHKTVIYCYNPSLAAKNLHAENLSDFEKRIKNPLSDITPKNLVIGCHTIPHTEIEEIAKNLNF